MMYFLLFLFLILVCFAVVFGMKNTAKGILIFTAAILILGIAAIAYNDRRIAKRQVEFETEHSALQAEVDAERAALQARARQLREKLEQENPGVFDEFSDDEIEARLIQRGAVK